MKERPILFSGPMVRAILDGRKTQTRRVVKPQPCVIDGVFMHHVSGPKWQSGLPNICPYGVPGDRLWVRETFCIETDTELPYSEDQLPNDRPIKSHEFEDIVWHQIPRYRATEDFDMLCVHEKCQGGPCEHPWTPSIFMPRWASRITLEITDVRVQRLQGIGEKDIEAEGVQLLNTNCEGECGSTPCSITRQPFINLWDSINSKTHPWASNPWLWCLTFKRV